MPYSVGYFVDVSKVGANDLTWDADARTLVVDAPDVTVAQPNTDEGRRTLVKTSGLFVTRAAGEALSQRASLHAEAVASKEAHSPERMAQARENARRAVAALMAKPLAAAGFTDARVIVTFPPERIDDRRWDVTKPIPEVLANTTSSVPPPDRVRTDQNPGALDNTAGDASWPPPRRRACARSPGSACSSS
jgi:hypothetical protein